MGNKRGHKGGHRRFTNPAEIAMKKEKEEREKEWRRKRGETIESDEEDEDNSQESESESEEEKPTRTDKRSTKPADDEEDESEEDESEDDEPLIEICNPNRMPAKVKKDVNKIANEKVTLTRKEREQLEEQKSKTQVNKSQMERDLARLALIKQKREEAAKKKVDPAKPQASGSKPVAKK